MQTIYFIILSCSFLAVIIITELIIRYAITNPRKDRLLYVMRSADTLARHIEEFLDELSKTCDNIEKLSATSYRIDGKLVLNPSKAPGFIYFMDYYINDIINPIMEYNIKRDTRLTIRLTILRMYSNIKDEYEEV